ncbi:EAL domain-containing protein [Clostridium sp. DL1XJH146]
MEKYFEEKQINIKEIIEKELITTMFQPIVSISGNTVTGVEALSRGTDGKSGEIIAPILLFEEAKKKNLNLELDRLCREKALSSFSKLYKEDEDILLFLNIDTSILEKCIDSNYLLQSVKRYNIEPSRIIIEVNESQCGNEKILKKFIKRYRDYGFLIALDDVGAGFSNLNRLSIVFPDIIKIDRALIKNIHNNYYNQEVLKSLVKLSNKLGAVIIVEGVETEEEALKVLQLGGNAIQGYYFLKPVLITKDKLENINKLVETLVKTFRKYNMLCINNERSRNKSFLDIFNYAVDRLVKISRGNYDNELFYVLSNYECIQCGYIMNKSGIQISNTVGVHNNIIEKTHPIFNPAKKGSNNSTKHYYYNTINNNEVYQSKSYLSMATGKLCCTFSKKYTTNEGESFILCIDFDG